MTTALIISGGGDKGAFAVGAIEVLLDKGYQFDIITGTSTGALIAPLVAIDDIEELTRLYTTIVKKDILRLNWWRPWKMWTTSLYHTKPLERLIRKTMKGERFERLQASSCQVYLCTVCVQNNAAWYWTQHPNDHTRVWAWANFDEFVRAVLGSTNQPVIMPASTIDDAQCYDGGIREIAPVSIARELGATELIVIANSPKQPASIPKQLSNIADIGLWSLNLMSTEILNNDIDMNDAIADLLVIRPKEELPSSGLAFVPKQMQQMRELGQQRAKEILA